MPRDLVNHGTNISVALNFDALVTGIFCIYFLFCNALFVHKLNIVFNFPCLTRKRRLFSPYVYRIMPLRKSCEWGAYLQSSWLLQCFLHTALEVFFGLLPRKYSYSCLACLGKLHKTCYGFIVSSTPKSPSPLKNDALFYKCYRLNYLMSSCVPFVWRLFLKMLPNVPFLCRNLLMFNYCYLLW